ncbi:MAG TPA: hypothetical protein VFK66_13665 [Oryzihumus sp.]|nr:hypothetical protein [Oryzihumus sp.]
MVRRSLLLPLLIPLLLLAACGQQRVGMPGGGGSGDGGFQQRATAVARAWRLHPPDQDWAHGFVPLQDLTLPPVDGFPDVATKQAFLAGLFRLKGTLPDTPASGSVRFPDGSLLRVPVVGARTAYRLMDRGGAACDGPTTPPPARDTQPAPPSAASPGGVTSTSLGPCTALTVTGARLSSAPLRTSRGVATVPVWLFSVEGLPLPVGRVAVSPDAVGQAPEPPALPSLPADTRLVAAQDLTGVGGQSLRFRVGVSPCDQDVRGRVLEADGVVVVGASVTHGNDGSACPAVMMLQPERVTLGAPLGGHLVVDVVTGRPMALNPATQAR